MPSQINYVLSSRFRPEQGYRIESRRGGGGYIRIYRVQDNNAGHIMHLVNAIGESLDAETATQHLNNLLAYDILTPDQCRLIASAISERTLAPMVRSDRNIIRARIFKNMLVSVIS